MRTPWWIKPILAVAGIALAVWQVQLLLGVLHGSAEPPVPDTARVESGPFLVGITREGTIGSADVVSVRAPRSGSTLTWVIDDGTQVEEDDVLVTEADLAERRVRSREYALTKAEKDVGYLGAEHESEQAQSQADIDAAEFEVDVAKRRIGEAGQSAKERAEMAKRRLEDMEEQLAAGELRAPKAGVVVLGKTWSSEGRRTLRAGDRIWHAMKVCDITGLSSLELKVRVEEASANRTEVGQEGVITVASDPDREFQGEVTSIGAVAHEISQLEDPRAVPGQRVFDVTVKILDPDPEALPPGASAEVQLLSKRIPEAVYVPKEAVFDKPEGKFVYVQRLGRFSRRRVETGERNDEAVVVVSGLSPGQRVALSEPTRLEAK